MARHLLYFAVVAIISCSSPPIKEASSPDLVLAGFNDSEVPGAAVIVLRGDSIVFRKAYGSAHVPGRSAVTPRTNFRLASVSKQFTATAVLLLIRDGRLTLETRLTDALQDFPAYGSTITVRHLLTHTSGLISYESLIPDSQTVQVHDRDVLRLLSTVDSTYFLPGSQFRYSNSGYALLALVVESVSGMPFAQFLKERVFVPAGMMNTVAFEEGTSTVSERAYGHDRTDSGWHVNDQSVTSAVLGDGGVYSSIDDLSRWCKALSSAVLLGEELQNEACSFQVRVSDSTAYGYGWHIRTSRGRTLVYHTGSTQGFRTALLRFIDDELSVVLLTNRNEGDVFAQAETIAASFLP